jgi:hypothetical protein
MFWLEFVDIGVPCSTAVLIALHSSADSQTFTLVVRESAVFRSAKWFAPFMYVCWIKHWVIVVVEFF